MEKTCNEIRWSQPDVWMEQKLQFNFGKIFGQTLNFENHMRPVMSLEKLLANIWPKLKLLESHDSENMR